MIDKYRFMREEELQVACIYSIREIEGLGSKLEVERRVCYTTDV